nr:hypothetical protein [Streptomyces brevispora]
MEPTPPPREEHDPWPSSDRYNWASHAWYVNNNEFSWTHSLYRIGA